MPTTAQLTSDLSKAMQSLSERKRRELVRLLGNPPDINNVPESFWQSVEEDERNRLTEFLGLLFLVKAMQPIKKGGGGLDEGDASGLAETFSKQRAEFVAKGFVKHSRNRLSKWMNKVAPGESISREEIISRTEGIFGRGRIDGVVITELTNAQTEAINAGRDRSDKALKSMWVLGPCRHCSFCPYVAGTSEVFWGQLIPGGPPAHVRCCCNVILVPKDQRERTNVNVTQARMLARESGVFGF